MKFHFLLFLVILILLFSCTSHYYRQNPESIDLFLKVHGASKVELVLCMDHIIVHKAQKISPNTWAVTLHNLEEFRYFYRIDGIIYLPQCRFMEKDDFGSDNCIFQSEM